MFLLLSCSAELAQPDIGEAVELDPAAQGVAAADLDGDGWDELFYVHEGVLSWPGGSLELEGTFQRAAAGDLDGDGAEELVVATGMSRDYRGPAHLERISKSGSKRIATFSGERTQVPELRVVEGRLWVARYADSRVVEAGWFQDDLQVAASGILATRSVPVGDEVVLAHVYGAEPKSDGYVALGDRRLASHRGARSLALADLDGDGDEDLLAGDGWHYAYGQQADGRVSLFEGPDFERSRTLAHFSEDYSARELEVMEGWILVTGTRQVHVLARDDLGWADHVVGEVDESGHAVFVRTPKGPAVLISGEPARLVPLK